MAAQFPAVYARRDPSRLRTRSICRTDALCSDCSVPLSDNGRVIRVFGAAGDVTEHRKAEDALRGHLRRSEMLLIFSMTPRRIPSISSSA
jgi:hypothetical protein